MEEQYFSKKFSAFKQNKSLETDVLTYFQRMRIKQPHIRAP